MPLFVNSTPVHAMLCSGVSFLRYFLAYLLKTPPLLILASSAIPSHCTSVHILCPDLLFLSLAIQPVTPLFYAIAKICRSAPCRSCSKLCPCSSVHVGASLFRSPSTQRFSLPSLIMPTRCYSFASLCSSILCLSLAFHFSASPFPSDAIPAMPLRREFC